MKATGHPSADQHRSHFSGCLVVGALLFLSLVVGIGFVVQGIRSGRLASTEALPQNKIPASQLNEISQIIGLRPDEQILYFYSARFTSAEDGNLFTNRRVISYTDQNGTPVISEASYDQVQDIDLFPSESWLDDSVVTVTMQDGSSFGMWVSTESSGDQAFFKRLVSEWKRATKPDQQEQ